MSFGSTAMNQPPRRRIQGTLKVSIPVRTGPRAATAEEISRLAQVGVGGATKPASAGPRFLPPQFDPGRNDLDLIRVWNNLSGEPEAVRKDGVGWILKAKGQNAGKTIVGPRNAREEATVLNVSFSEIDKWWRTWQPKWRQHWRLVQEAGEEPRVLIVRLEAVSKLRRCGDDATWLCLRNTRSDPVLIAAPFEEVYAWWASYPKAKEDRR